MSNWKPSSNPDAAKRRAALLERARHHFREQNVLAIDTPALSRHAVTDPNIDSLTVTSASAGEHYLHTSPEFCMKRLLAAGYPDIYSICRVFRDGEAGKRHHPEFTMAEWYRLGFELNAIIDDTIQFVVRCLDEPKLASNVIRYDYAEALQLFANINVNEASADDLANRCSADANLRSEIATQRDIGLDLILGTVVAPKFSREYLTILQHYPASQAALARLCPNDEQVSDRFEIFYGDMELANGYVELTNAAEQRQRIEQDLESRRRSGRREYPRDEAFLAALDSGLPHCAGVAVGIERLQMVLDKTDDIKDVVAFAFE